MIQEILVYVGLIFAVVFLVRKFFYMPKKKQGNCDTDCNC
jgi:hypothetical protein